MALNFESRWAKESKEYFKASTCYDYWRGSQFGGVGLSQRTPTMDFGVASPDSVTREFLAVVLAGFGNEWVGRLGDFQLKTWRSSRLVPLTSDYGEEPCPKSLLPIGNNPMLGYPLSWIERSGVTSEFPSLSYLSAKGLMQMSCSYAHPLTGLLFRIIYIPIHHHHHSLLCALISNLMTSPKNSALVHALCSGTSQIVSQEILSLFPVTLSRHRLCRSPNFWTSSGQTRHLTEPFPLHVGLNHRIKTSARTPFRKSGCLPVTWFK